MWPDGVQRPQIGDEVVVTSRGRRRGRVADIETVAGERVYLVEYESVPSDPSLATRAERERHTVHELAPT